MGTINYKRSNYITIGYNCNNIDYDEYEWSAETIAEYYETVAAIRAEYNFYYFHVAIEPGYYEGFSIDIELNFSWCFDNCREKIEAQKEITEIKKFLLKCINDFECCAVFPGWCTRYADYSETIKLLNGAIKEMREAVKNTPTWHTLPASEKYA